MKKWYKIFYVVFVLNGNTISTMLSATFMTMEKQEFRKNEKIQKDLGKSNNSSDLMFDLELDIDQDQKIDDNETPTNKSPKSFPKDNFNHLLEQTSSDKYIKIPYRTTCAFDPVQMSASPPGGKFMYNLKRRIDMNF